MPLKLSPEHKKLWKLTSEYVRRSGSTNGYNRCYTCGTLKPWQELDAGHFIDKSVCGAQLYFDIRQVKPQCVACNRYKHGMKDVYAHKLVQEYGKGILDTLFGIKQIIRKWDKSRYLEEIEKTKRMLSELKGE